jgi:LysR family transcriptional regulator, nod-box dependent transcriptional activator
MVLTPLAESLAKPVHDLLHQVQATVIARPLFDPATSKRRFSISLSDYVTSVFMADALREVQRRAPYITFELQPLGRRAMEALENRTLDFLIVMDVFSHNGHPKMRLFEDTHTCIAWDRNSRIGSKVTVEEYLNLGHVTARIAEAQHPNFEEHFLRRLKFNTRAEVVVMHGSSFLPDFIVGTDRIASIPTRLAQKYAQSFPLKVVDAPIELPPIVEVLQWHKSNDQSPAYIWLRGVLREQAAKLAGLSSESNGLRLIKHAGEYGPRTTCRRPLGRKR